MKLRKLSLTIASVVMAAGSAAAIAPAQAESISDYTKYFTGQQYADWKNRTEGCTSLYGEQYRSDCEYYSVAVEWYNYFDAEGNEEEYLRYASRASEIWDKLYDLKYGEQ